MFLTHFFRLPYIFVGFKKAQNMKKYDDETRYDFLRRNIPRVLKRGRVNVIATGLENIPETDGFIVYPNHQGMFDVLNFIKAVPKRLVPLMKVENKKVPLLRGLIPIYNSELMDRSDVRQSMKVIQNITARVKNGENFLIFAEGTRSKRGNLMGTMKGGSFKAATMAQCPIVPAALIDSGKPFDEGGIRKVTVQVHILPAITYDEYKDLKTNDIAELVERRIKEKIAEVVPDSDPAKNPNYKILNAHITAEEEAKLEKEKAEKKAAAVEKAEKEEKAEK